MYRVQLVNLVYRDLLVFLVSLVSKDLRVKPEIKASKVTRAYRDLKVRMVLLVHLVTVPIKWLLTMVSLVMSRHGSTLCRVLKAQQVVVQT